MRKINHNVLFCSITVNQRVLGSSPSSGASHSRNWVAFLYLYISLLPKTGNVDKSGENEDRLRVCIDGCVSMVLTL